MRTAGKSSLAVGAKYMDMNYKQKSDSHYAAKQVYLAATYSGDFFSMPAETTLFFGKTWGIKNYQGHNDDWDFGMGFDLDLFPSLFKGYIHWINDFANFSYSPEAVGADAYYRGAFNTGFRIAVLKDYNRFKLNLDALLLDVLDHNRSWSFGITGGISF